LAEEKQEGLPEYCIIMKDPDLIFLDSDLRLFHLKI